MGEKKANKLMVEKRHREALKANNRMNKYGNSEPPKQKIKITIGEAAVKWENYLSIPKLHDRSSLPCRHSKHKDAFSPKW